MLCVTGYHIAWIPTRGASAREHLFDDVVSTLHTLRTTYPNACIGTITNGLGSAAGAGLGDYFDFEISADGKSIWLFLVIFGYFWLFLAISVWAIRLTRVFCSTLQDLILTETDAADAGSSAGRVIVGGSVLWMTIAGYFALNASRWLCARCYEHYLRARLFAACTDPQEAALFDVP